MVYNFEKKEDGSVTLEKEQKNRVLREEVKKIGKDRSWKDIRS